MTIVTVLEVYDLLSSYFCYYIYGSAVVLLADNMVTE